MKKIIFLLLLVIVSFASAQDYIPIDNIIINNSAYEVQAKFDSSSFKLKTIDASNKNKETINYMYDIELEVFAASFINHLKTIDNGVKDNILEEKQAIESLRKKILAKKEALKTESQRLTEGIDGLEDEYSGKIILNKTITLKPDKKCKGQTDNVNSLTEATLNIEKAYLNFFNNKASTILIEGNINGNDNVVILNDEYSIPIRYFNNSGNTNSFKVNGSCYTIDYNSVFDFKSDQHFNYSLANEELVLTPDKPSQRVKQRRFFDFFTAILYTDAMAFDNNQTNSLVNAQARLLLPLNQRNSSNFLFTGGNYTLLRQLTTEVNVALYNGSNNELREIQLVTNGSEPLSFEHFELLTKNNFSGTLNLELLTHEAKRFFSHISLGYNASFYRTAINNTIVNTVGQDDNKTGSLFSVSHGPILNIEIRPQTNFGADVNVSLNNLTYNGADSVAGIEDVSALINNNDIRHFVAKYNVVNIKADFYWLTNPEKGSKSGIFARLGGFYHADSYQIHPQLFVGYATNLTSFVNRFKK
ncbi:hypothetical protein [Lacinutrix salivirga]